MDLLVIAGEHSGDEHAARMIRDARKLRPNLKVAALGGGHLEAAGAQLLFNLVDSSVVGVFEVLANYSFFKQVFAETLRWIAQYRPRAVCFIDYPGFNLRVAREMRIRGLSAKGGGPTRALYYISPQIWAWKAGRRFTMAEDLDALAVIFPFEKKVYADTKLPVVFVGHPFVAPGYTSPVRYDPDGPVLLLPGSRRAAVGRIFPALLAGFRESVRQSRESVRQSHVGPPLAARLPVRASPGPDPVGVAGARSVALYPSDAIRDELKNAQDRAPASDAPTDLRPTPSPGAPPIGASAVLTSSGTMSMHCALAGIPGAIAYRANPLTYLIGRQLVKVPYLGIANLILGEAMYPEYIQGAATAEALAAELRACVRDPARRERTRQLAEKLRSSLCVDTGGTAADWLLGRLDST